MNAKIKPGQMTWNVTPGRNGLYLRKDEESPWVYWSDYGIPERRQVPMQFSSGYGLFLDLLEKGWKAVYRGF